MPVICMLYLFCLLFVVGTASQKFPRETMPISESGASMPSPIIISSSSTVGSTGILDTTDIMEATDAVDSSRTHSQTVSDTARNQLFPSPHASSFHTGTVSHQPHALPTGEEKLSYARL